MTHAAVTSSPTHDPAFAAFLAERPQLVQIPHTGPQFSCGCGVWGIGGAPIVVRHGEGCQAAGSDTVVYARVERDGTPARAMIQRATDLDALAAWIPVPPAPPVVDPVVGEVAIRHMVDVLGFHLIPLRCGEKLNAAGRGWNDPTLFPALTADAAVAHVAGGGNLGVLLGPSRLLVIDSEDSAATAALVAAGLSPTVLTAKGQCPVACDPRMDKRGGAHFWFVLPDGFDYSGIGNAGQVGLPGGGKVDVLVSPGAMVVVPPTVLIEAGGWAYAPAEHPTWAYGAVDPAPEWLFDAGAPCPESIASLSGVVAPVAPRVRALRTERDQEIDDAVDDIDWADVIVLAGGRIQDWGRTDSCGCSEYHWYASEKPRSLVTHDCGEGKYAFVPSLTMRAELGLSKDTCSSLTLACRLLGRDHRGESAREVGRMLGVELPPPAGALPGFHPNDFEAAAAAAEAAAVDPAVLTTVTLPEGSVAPPPVATDRDGLLAWAARLRSSAAILRNELTAAEARAAAVWGTAGVVREPEAPVGGVVAGAINPTPGVLPRMGPDGKPVATVVGGVSAGAGGAEPDTGLALLTAIDAIDASGFWDTLPVLTVTARAADSNGVGRWGLLGAMLPRIACTIPPHVRLVNAAGHEGGPNSGASLNLFSILTGPPEEGKSETIKLAADLVPLPSSVGKATTGTGEGIIKSFGYMKKSKGGDSDEAPEPTLVPPGEPLVGGTAPPIGSVGGNDLDAFSAAHAGYEYVRITDTVMLTAAEISGMIAEMGRQGTKATAVYRSTWMGEEVGTTAGEVERRTFLEPHSYRFGSVLGAQIDLDALWPIFREAKLGSPQRFGFFPVCTVGAVGEPLRELRFTPVDWAGGGGVAAHTAALAEGGHRPVWIHRPAAAAAEIEANREARRARRHLAYSTAEVFRRAEADDSTDDVRGHELLHQLKIAAVLAVGDGLREPTDSHWHAAGVVMRVRTLMVDTILKVLAAQLEVADRKQGRSRGRTQAEAKRAEVAAKRDYDTEVAGRVAEVLRGAGELMTEAAIGRLIGKTQATALPDVLKAMVKSETIEIAGANIRGNALYRLLPHP